MELDHFVLEVSDPEGAARFFRETLGLESVRMEEWRQGKVPFPSLRVSEGLIIDLFPKKMWRSGAPQNPNHFCFNVSRARFDEIAARVTIVRRDEHNYGARGYARSIYFDGPDSLSVEVRTYGA
jgi:catechol 2,3-dioxygenase-like lactoylglutathione lyase family enzyme